MTPSKIIRSKRKTLSLTINENAELVVRAPIRLSIEKIQDFINEKEKWIRTKTKLIDVIRGPIRRLVKFKFEAMFMEDRLFQNLPNVSSWLAQTFTTMDKYAEQTDG